MKRLISTVINSWNKNWPEFWCAARGGIPSFVFEAEPRPIGCAVPVFHYHLVDAGRFEEDLRFLERNGYGTATSDQLADHLEGGRPLDGAHVVLSFDDGPVNLYKVAYPLLRRFGQRGVAFICPGLHGAARGDDRDDRLCTWDEIHEMHDAGVIDFQSHTWEHRLVSHWPQPWPLTGVDDALVQQARGEPLSLEDDLRKARQEMQRRLGKGIEHLAFPNYRATSAGMVTAKRVGYRGLWLGTLPGRPWNIPGDSAQKIVRLSGEFLRRLPGRGRRSLGVILRERYAASLERMLRQRLRTRDCLDPMPTKAAH